uniref:Sodium-dependent phosphate transporter n=1 Tax=Acrobeloides nanus TaxID=290746 RepID=A0A914CH60_9BILA
MVAEQNSINGYQMEKRELGGQYFPLPKDTMVAEIEENIWDVSDTDLVRTDLAKWKDLTRKEKVLRILKYIWMTILALLVIFAFICSLSLLADSLKLIGGRGLGSVIKNSDIIQNPISASIIGMIVTIILQNSSTLNSILVGMIAGGLITVHQSIPIMLGAEMGGSLTNALISLTQSGHRDQFRRAFAAVTLNDIFNFLSYFIFLPIEMATGFIEKISDLLVQPFSKIKTKNLVTLNLLTDPVLNYIVQVEISDRSSTGHHGNEIYIRKMVAADLPQPFTCLTNYLLIVIGCVIVMIMRSSSVFRTVLTPLVGIGVVTLHKLYPLILGGNIGTTFTAALAALSADPARIKETLQMALSQTTYNVVGVLLFYPIPFMRAIPIHLAKKLGNIVAKYRWFAFVYIALVFIILPGLLPRDYGQKWAVFHFTHWTVHQPRTIHPLDTLLPIDTSLTIDTSPTMDTSPTINTSSIGHFTHWTVRPP